MYKTSLKRNIETENFKIPIAIIPIIFQTCLLLSFFVSIKFKVGKS